MDLARLQETFIDLFGETPRFFRAPGRINLIGEHTDYNDGFVLPAAIDKQTVVAACPRNDRKVIVHSLNFDQTVEFDLSEAPGKRKKASNPSWQGYVEGTARVLEAEGFKLSGANMLVLSDITLGAGLSSSAALELAIGFALTQISGHSIDKLKLAQIGQRAEHEYAGTRCGIMDQYVSAFGKADHALLLDCRSMTSKSVPIDATASSIVVCESKVGHELAVSEYNKRRAECERAVQILHKFDPDFTSLRDVPVEMFDKLAPHLPEAIRRRVKHVVTENERTREAALALKKGDITKVGELMYSSHKSLKDDYAVSCRELDLLVDIARSIDGTFGARMTGGGFGGCTVNIIEKDLVEYFKQTLGRRYREETGIIPSLHVVNASGGVSEIKDLTERKKTFSLGMRQKRTTLPDGRYLLYYSFDSEKEKGGSSETSHV